VQWAAGLCLARRIGLDPVEIMPENPAESGKEENMKANESFLFSCFPYSICL
jgi:hypothetical protein